MDDGDGSQVSSVSSTVFFSPNVPTETIHRSSGPFALASVHTPRSHTLVLESSVQVHISLLCTRQEYVSPSNILTSNEHTNTLSYFRVLSEVFFLFFVLLPSSSFFLLFCCERGVCLYTSRGECTCIHIRIHVWAWRSDRGAVRYKCILPWRDRKGM